MNLYTCTVPRKSSGWNVNSMIGWIQPALFQCSLHVPVLLCAGYTGPHWMLGLAWHYMCTYANAQWGTCIAFRCILQKHDMIYDIIYSHPPTICTRMQYFPLFLDTQLLKGLLHDAVWLHDTLGTTGNAVTSRYFKRASLQDFPHSSPRWTRKKPAKPKRNKAAKQRPILTEFLSDQVKTCCSKNGWCNAMYCLSLKVVIFCEYGKTANQHRQNTETPSI